jgi:D-glycero-D-manno-heptose 1,7-bisphosphate phosphatase
MTARMKDDLARQFAVLDGIYYCMHHPDAVVTEYQVTCDCRKPKPGLLKQAALEMNLELAGSYMIGDQPRDVAAGKAVGCTTFLVGPEAGTAAECGPDQLSRDLNAAARLIAELEAAALHVHLAGRRL